MTKVEREKEIVVYRRHVTTGSERSRSGKRSKNKPVFSQLNFFSFSPKAIWAYASCFFPTTITNLLFTSASTKKYFNEYF